MPDLSDRARRENELAALILLVFRRHSAQAMVDWAAFESDLMLALQPALAATYNVSFEQLKGLVQKTAGDTVSVPANGKDWAAGYADTLAKAIVQATKDGALPANLQFSPERANRIAITETTRAITAGEMGAITALTSLSLLRGQTLEPIWHTAEDDLVCRACRPLNKTTRETWSVEAPAGPPLHPHCRCYLDYAILGLNQRESIIEDVQEGYDESEHPRDDHGRFVDKNSIAAAKKDPNRADELRARVTNKDELSKLNKMLGTSETAPEKKVQDKKETKS